MPRTRFNRRRILVVIAGIVGAAALFSSGALVARATMDDNDSPPAVGSTEPAGAIGSPKTLIAPVPPQGGDASVGSADGRSGAPDTALSSGEYYGGCLAPLPAGVIVDGVIDPTKAGFAMSLLGAGFTLTSASLSSQGDCEKDGSQPAASGELTLQTSWRHDSSRFELYVSQRLTGQRVANVLARGSANFWANGYAYTVSANGGIVSLAVDSPSPVIDPAGGANDAKLLEVIGLAVGQLAPSVGMQCFYREAEAGWEGLAALGIGDPRSAIPSGYVEQNVSVRTFIPPAAGCDTPAPEDQGGFDAGFAKTVAGGDFGGFIGMSAYALPKDQPAYPGQLTQYGANWNNGRFQFNVYAKALEPVGLDTIRAIAKALDPTFNETCLVQQRELTDAEVSTAGFRSPALPEGFKITKSSRTVLEVGAPGANCPIPPGFEKHYNLAWTLEGGATTIEINVNRAGIADKGQGWISNSTIVWIAADGTMYNVNGYSRGTSPAIDKEQLVAVAKSLDPTLDITKLTQAPDSAGGSSPGAEPAPGRK